MAGRYQGTTTVAERFSAEAATDQTRSCLLALPAELRNTIYGMVFEDCVTLIQRTCKARPDSIGVLLACKQTHVEAIEIYYKTTIIASLPTPRFFGIWLSKIPRRYYNLIPELRIIILDKKDWSEFVAEAQQVLVREIEDAGVSLRHKKFSVEVRTQEPFDLASFETYRSYRVVESASKRVLLYRQKAHYSSIKCAEEFKDWYDLHRN